jgi:ketosteroid isomerase-like protein
MAQTEDMDAVLDAENRRRAALVAVDLKELDRLFAEDLIHVHSTGLVHTKAELLRHIDQKRAFLAVDRGPLQIRIEGDIALMTGLMINRMRAKDGNGEILLHGFVTQVLRRSTRGWRFIRFQLTPVREQ